MRFLRVVAIILCLTTISSCATYFHPERAAVPVTKRGRIDGLMLAFDIAFTLGLGLIVDFFHGTIWLPLEGYAGPSGVSESDRSD